MEINALENIEIQWEERPIERIDGLSGFVLARTVEVSVYRIRQLTFSNNYEADHWCEKGHIIFVLQGELIIERKDDYPLVIKANNSLVLGDNLSWHKARTEVQTIALIVD